MRLATVERLEINVETNAGNAASQLKSLADAVQSVSKSASKQTPVPLDTQKIISAATKVDVLKAKYEALAVAMNKAFIAGDTNKAWQLRGQMLQVEDALAKATAAANQNASATARVGTAARGAAHGGISNFLASLKRIMFYRFIRSIIKSITEAFKDGLKNAYAFSKGIGGTLAAALDNLATKSLTMKNQLGAAFGSLLEAIMPIILKIVELIRMAAQAISALFSAFSGGDYLIANDVAQSWDAATGAAKKYKNTILGFDEINRLDEPSGGGGGSAANANNMFRVGELPGWAQKIADFVSDLKISFKDIFVDWEGLNGEQIAKKVIAGLGGLVGAAVGFMIGGVPGAIKGALVGVSLATVFSSVVFDNDGVLGETEVYTMVCSVLGALVGGIIGFQVGGARGAAIGAVVGAGATVLLSKMAFQKDGEDQSAALQTMSVALTALTLGVIGFKVGGISGAAIGAAVGVGVGLLINAAIFQKGKTQDEISIDLIKGLVNVLGAIAGAAIGFAVGGVAGAAIGALIGVSITLLATSVNWDKGTTDAIRNARVDIEGYQTTYGFMGEAVRGSLLGYASGGFPSQGSLFIAGEAGAEIVSTTNSGATQVSNTNQIAASVSAGNIGVIQAINDLIRAVENKDTNPVVTIGDRDVYRAAQRGQQTVGRSLVATV